MTPLDLFLPRNQNMIQRVGYAVALLGMLAVVVLHNPFEGYTFVELKTWTDLQPKPNACTKAELDEGSMLKGTAGIGFEGFVKIFGPPENSKVWTEEQRRLFGGPENSGQWTVEQRLKFANSRQTRWQSLSEKCFIQIGDSLRVTLPVSEWSSDAPLISWLGSVVHLLQVVLSILVALIIWLVIFRDEHSESKK